jgi:hypothetical protein
LLNESAFGLMWGLLYVLSVCSTVIIGNYITNIKCINATHSVFYTNAMASNMVFIMSACTGELSAACGQTITTSTLFLILLSCFASIWISHAGWACQTNLSCTAYGIVNITSKSVTIVINQIFIKQSNTISLISVLLCLCVTPLYQQAPRKNIQVENKHLLHETS